MRIFRQGVHSIALKMNLRFGFAQSLGTQTTSVTDCMANFLKKIRRALPDKYNVVQRSCIAWTSRVEAVASQMNRIDPAAYQSLVCAEVSRDTHYTMLF